MEASKTWSGEQTRTATVEGMAVADEVPAPGETGVAEAHDETVEVQAQGATATARAPEEPVEAPGGHRWVGSAVPCHARAGVLRHTGTA